jgi:hypothetical protein
VVDSCEYGDEPEGSGIMKLLLLSSSSSSLLLLSLSSSLLLQSHQFFKRDQ